MHVEPMGVKSYKVSAGKPEEMESLREPRQRWEDSVKDVGLKDVDLKSFSSEQITVAGSCQHGKEPSHSTKGKIS
jgi:hypothetical protein